MIARWELNLLLAAILTAGLAGMYFYAKHEGRMEEREVWELKEAAATKEDLDGLKEAVVMANNIAMGTQELLNKGKAKSVIDRGVIEREIRTDVRYISDCLPDTGIMRWKSISKDGTVLPDSGAIVQPDAAVPTGVRPADPGRKGGIATPQPPGLKANIR